ncbi:MAG: hypothetical protein ACT4NL_06020 [Pseudomarimonas sp.]
MSRPRSGALSKVWVLTCVFVSGCVQTVDRPNLPPAPSPIAGCSAGSVLQRGGQLIDTFSRGLVKDLVHSFQQPPNSSNRVALLPIRAEVMNSNTRAQDLAQTLGDSLKDEIFRARRFQIVADHDMGRASEQLRINDVLLSRGALDKSSQSRLGQAVSADFIVDGRISDSATDHTVLLEMIDVGSGQTVATARGRLPKNLITCVRTATP